MSLSLSPGAKLGAYELGGPLGKGGMGEVYRARDTKLGREVAIKILPDAFANDESRLERFEREAKLLASLNHANVATLFGVEESEGRRFLVLELVEGETLAERIARGPIGQEEAIRLALQIVEALEAAHERGVIHRDLKPANVKVTPDGKIKVLDFGLAKAFAPEDSDPSVSNSPTLSRAATLEGVVLGTAAYMSPEQAKGLPVDKRTDFFSFGCVLFEMLTGRQAFPGELAAEILASVIRAAPDEAALPSSLHPRVRELLDRCFEKDPKRRWQAAGDIRVELERALAHPDETPARAGGAMSFTAKLRLVLPWAVASALVAGASGWFLHPTEPRSVTRFVNDLPDGSRFTNAGRRVIDVSRDGSQIVYVANFKLYLRSMETNEPRELPGIEEGGVTSPVFSPDGRWVAYWSQREGQLKKIATNGGRPVTLADTSNPLGMSWSDDEMIVFSSDEGILRVSANGGTPEVLIRAEAGERFQGPSILPGADELLFSVGPTVSMAPWDESEIVVQTLDTSERRVVWRGGADARYLPTGHLVYASGSDLFAVPFDLGALEVVGGPVPLVEGLQRGVPSGAGHYGVSASGTLVYVDVFNVRADERLLALVDLEGTTTKLDVPPAPYQSPRISPDGQRIAVQTEGDDGSIVWIYELAGGAAMRQLTFEGNNQRPIWTPDGRDITFTSDRDGSLSLYMQPADGSGVAERLTLAEGRTEHRAGSWSPDGRTLAFTVALDDESWDIWRLTRNEDGEPETLYSVPGRTHHGPQFSPDGKWLAYGVGDTLVNQDVYIEPYPPTGARRRISQEGGYFPLWAPDASALYYRRVSRQVTDQLQAVDVTLAPELRYGNERAVPLGGFLTFATYRDYDITPDGRQFVVVVPANEEPTTSRQRIHVVLNWLEELKERAPN